MVGAFLSRLTLIAGRLVCGAMGHDDRVRRVTDDGRLYVECLRCTMPSVGVVPTQSYAAAPSRAATWWLALTAAPGVPVRARDAVNGNLAPGNRRDTSRRQSRPPSVSRLPGSQMESGRWLDVPARGRRGPARTATLKGW